MDRLRRAQAARAHLPLIHNRAGEAYTLDGISAMLRRHQKAAGVASFGLQDLKTKGATDMYLAGVPLEQIQALCGHESAITTEIYVKRHLKTIAQPNRLGVSG